MVTSIQLSQRTRNRLLKYKRDEKKTYEQVILDLLEKHEDIPASMYGSIPELGPWSRKYRTRGRYE